MISLFGRDEYALAGVAALLEIDKIPYRRLRHVEARDENLLLVAGAELTAGDIAMLHHRPTLVLDGGPLFAQQVFRISSAMHDNRPCAIDLEQPIWPAAVVELAARFGKRELQLPLAPFCVAPHLGRGTVLATQSSPLATPPQPAVVRLDECVWCTVDLGTAFANLITESYWPARRARSPFQLAARRFAEGLYYALPRRARELAQRQSYSVLERRLHMADSGRVSEYPLDASGWLLSELLRSLLLLAAGSLLRLERWPAPFASAAAMTADVEPHRYAYEHGLGRLLCHPATARHSTSFGLVAEAAGAHLRQSDGDHLAAHEVYCHGLTHRGDPVVGRGAVARRMRTARALLEERIGRAVVGYRSPRLDRSADLQWALDDCGFEYDSSYPDIDRENTAHYGSGVRLNVPFRPPLADGRGAFRRSRCLELPLTAPDCIQPLFGGVSLQDLRRTVAEKADFVRSTGGLYLALVHAGVFGNDDAGRREDHLAFVCSQLQHPETWFATQAEIATWWTQREQLHVDATRAGATIRNDGERTVFSVRLVLEQDGGSTSIAVPPLEPGAVVELSLRRQEPLPAA